MNKIVYLLVMSWTILYANEGISLEKIFQTSFSKESQVGQKNIILSQVEKLDLQKQSRARIDTNKIRLYVVQNKKNIEGYGVLLSKRIRTKKATILYIIDKDLKIITIEILSFSEPSEYKPNQAWQALFKGKSQNDNLFAGKGIPTISGATMSARSISDASRIALAIVQKYKY